MFAPTQSSNIASPFGFATFTSKLRSLETEQKHCAGAPKNKQEDLKPVDCTATLMNAVRTAYKRNSSDTENVQNLLSILNAKAFSKEAAMPVLNNNTPVAETPLTFKFLNPCPLTGELVRSTSSTTSATASFNWDEENSMPALSNSSSASSVEDTPLSFKFLELASDMVESYSSSNEVKFSFGPLESTSSTSKAKFTFGPIDNVSPTTESMFSFGPMECTASTNEPKFSFGPTQFEDDTPLSFKFLELCPFTGELLESSSSSNTATASFTFGPLEVESDDDILQWDLGASEKWVDALVNDD